MISALQEADEKTWHLKLQNYFITKAKMKRELLLLYAGEWIFNIFLNLPDTGNNADIYLAVALFNRHFSLQSNTNYEIFKFREATQLQKETLN